MISVDWKDVLGWSGEQIRDLRVAGYSYLRQGMYHRAITFFEALVALDSKSFYDLHSLGGLYLQTGNLRRALDYFNRALELDNTYPPLLLNRAKALLLLGEREEGMALAQSLVTVKNRRVRNLAQALLMAYS
jgi:tetratricopeptide (TPR) repeat protein